MSYARLNEIAQSKRHFALASEYADDNEILAESELHLWQEAAGLLAVTDAPVIVRNQRRLRLQTLNRLGTVAASNDQWKEAAKHFEDLTAAEPNSHAHWRHRAYSQMKLGNREELAEICSEMLTRFVNEVDQEYLDRIAKICLTVPQLTIDSDRVHEIARRKPSDDDHPKHVITWHHFVAGLSAYRSQDYQLAVDELRIAVPRLVYADSRRTSKLLLAMSLYRAGLTGEAIDLYETTMEFVGRHFEDSALSFSMVGRVGLCTR